MRKPKESKYLVIRTAKKINRNTQKYIVVVQKDIVRLVLKKVFFCRFEHVQIKWENLHLRDFNARYIKESDWDLRNNKRD